MRTAILHIGPPKTGSTSIQRYLTEAREALLARDFVVPAFAGRRNHIALAALGVRDNHGANVLRRAGAHDDPATLGKRLARDLAEEMAALPASVHTAIFSSEQLAVRIKDTGGLARLRDFLAPHFGAFRVIAYLRRQDELAVSHYSTGLRSGGETSAAIFPAADEEGGVYDLAGILDRYAAVFGRDAVRPRLFDRSLLVDGDVVTDFLRTIGIDDLTPPAEGVRNPSLRAAVQELVRRYNERVEARGLQDRPRIGQFLREERYWGRGRMPPRAEAEAFLARFAEGNERIRATWFPDRASLFSTDFSRYPEAEDTAATADAAVLEAALDVLVDLGAERQESEVERRMIVGRQALAEGRYADARSQFSRVLRYAAGHRGATKALREVDVAEGLLPSADAAARDADEDQDAAAAPATAADRAARRKARKQGRDPDRRAAREGRDPETRAGRDPDRRAAREGRNADRRAAREGRDAERRAAREGRERDRRGVRASGGGGAPEADAQGEPAAPPPPLADAPAPLPAARVEDADHLRAAQHPDAGGGGVAREERPKARAGTSARRAPRGRPPAA